MALNGSVQVTKGIFDRLKRDGVEDAIKAKYWSNQITDPAKLRAVWKYRAKPGVQMPYAVYTVPTDTMLMQSTGTTANTSFQYRQALVQFLCYAASDDRSDETWAIGIAEFIDNAMNNGKLCFADKTRFITLIRQADIETSNPDDDAIVIGISYLIEYELEVDLAKQLA